MNSMELEVRGLNRGGLVAVLAACGLAASAACGQAQAPAAPAPPPAMGSLERISAENDTDGPFTIEKKVGENPPTIEPEDVEGNSSNMFITVNQDLRVRVRVVDDEVRISVNGKKIGAETMTDASWSELRIKDAKGNVVATLLKSDEGRLEAVSGDWTEELRREREEYRKQAAEYHERALASQRDALLMQETARAQAREALGRAYTVGRGASGGGGTWNQRGLSSTGPAIAYFDSPRVMMGVTMSEPSEELAHQAGIDPEEATVITGVTKDLPAAKAGLKKYDIVVKVDGETPADEGTIREKLREKNAGDQLKFEVLRKGERQEVTITLEEYDSERLNAWTTQGFAIAPENFGGQLGGGFGGTTSLFGTIDEQRAFEAKQQELAQLAQKLQELSVKLHTERGAAAEKAAKEMSELGERLSELGAQVAERSAARAWMIDSTGQGRALSPRARVRIAPAAPGQPADVIVLPPDAPAEPSDPADMSSDGTRRDRDRMIDERLERLEKLLEKVIETQAKDGGTKKEQ